MLETIAGNARALSDSGPGIARPPCAPRNLLVERGPDPGPSGFEYPLAPAEIFLELQHTY
jgi:hypothetical protein